MNLKGEPVVDFAGRAAEQLAAGAYGIDAMPDMSAIEDTEHPHDVADLIKFDASKDSIIERGIVRPAGSSSGTGNTGGSRAARALAVT